VKRIDAHAEGPERAARRHTLADFSIVAAGTIQAFRPDSLDRTFRMPKVAEKFAHLGAAVGQYWRRFEIAVDFPHFGEICRCLGAALFRLDLHSGDRPMIFLHRLGIVLYWVGYVFAILFAIVGLLIALNGLSFGGPISEAWVFVVLSVVTWLWGRAMKYILTDT
jgi:hypothetical protein